MVSRQCFQRSRHRESEQELEDSAPLLIYLVLGRDLKRGRSPHSLPHSRATRG